MGLFDRSAPEVVNVASIYPASFSDWLALIGALVPVVIWAISGVFRAYAYRNEQSRKSWYRFYEISKILYNKDFDEGALAQFAAVQELEHLGVSRAAKAKILREALRFWDRQGDPEFIQEVRRVLACNQ